MFIKPPIREVEYLRGEKIINKPVKKFRVCKNDDGLYKVQQYVDMRNLFFWWKVEGVWKDYGYILYRDKESAVGLIEYIKNRDSKLEKLNHNWTCEGEY